jgi:uncharacterized membrane protein
MASSHIDTRIIDAVRHAVSSIENQHSAFLSVMLSVLLGIMCSKIIEGCFRHGIVILHNVTELLNLFLFFVVTLFIGSLLIIGFYLLFEGRYSSTFTLVFDVSHFLETGESCLRMP